MLNIFAILGPIVLGIAVAGILVFLKRVLRLPLPGWSIPMLAAIAMILAHIYNEYSWFDRFSAELPEGVEVVETLTTTGWYEPWTYLKPRINRFSAIDTSTVQVNPAHPDLALGQVILVERHSPTASVVQLADCRNNRTADIPANAQFGDDGLPLGVTWIDREPDSPILAALCRIAAGKLGA